MAREWQPASSFSLMPHEIEPDAEGSLSHSGASNRNWSAARGSVLWEGSVDLAGSFPGFANWGSRAQSVHLTLTNHYLLVDEGTDYGFGLPIGWLSAAQALTGVEPVATETGDHLRICYLDGDRVRGFSLRVRGGRFGSRSARRANQLRTAAISLGLASTTPSTNLLLPPEHDLSLNWDDFASYESEPVVWSGRAAMPVGSGLESALCDVWLTSASLIWGASSRAGIYRIATESLAAIATAETPGYEPVIYWTIGGYHQTHVDLPMIFARPDRNDPQPATRESLITLLESQGRQIDSPASPPQPWRPVVVNTPRVAEPAISTGPDALTILTSNRQSESLPATTGRPTRSVEASRRRLMDDGLFPERVPPTLPRSSPRPWGDRVERVGDDAHPQDSSGDVSVSPIRADPPAEPHEPVADRLRIWPTVAPRRQTSPSGRDATAMLVRRPRVRATTTEEFLASEQAARAAAETADAVAPDALTGTSSELETSAVRHAGTERGVIVRFRRPQTAIAGLVESVQRATESVVARSTSSFRVAKPEPGDEPMDLLALQSGIEEPVRGEISLASAKITVVEVAGTGPTAQGVSNGESFRPGVGVFDSIDVTAPSSGDEATTNGAAHELSTNTVLTEAAPSHLAMMRSAELVIDAQRTQAIRSLNHTPGTIREAAVSATAPFLAQALAELDNAVSHGEIAPAAAEVYRHTIACSADTTERLRSLLDLHARGYLSLPELESRRDALLGQEPTAS